MQTQSKNHIWIVLAFALGLFSASGMAGGRGSSEGACVGFGPQAPRDIDNRAGENKLIFSLAPSHTEINLCNIHFHSHAEHKAKDFSIYAGEGDHGHGGGYQCLDSTSLTAAELKAPQKTTVKA